MPVHVIAGALQRIRLVNRAVGVDEIVIANARPRLFAPARIRRHVQFRDARRADRRRRRRVVDRDVRDLAGGPPLKAQRRVRRQLAGDRPHRRLRYNIRARLLLRVGNLRQQPLLFRLEPCLLLLQELDRALGDL